MDFNTPEIRSYSYEEIIEIINASACGSNTIYCCCFEACHEHTDTYSSRLCA